MQEVSRAWKEAQRELLVPESFVEIHLELGDPQAQLAAELTDNGHELPATPGDVLTGTASPIKYASLEPFLWVLDGSFYILGSDSEEEFEGFIPAGEREALELADGQALFCKS